MADGSPREGFGGPRPYGQHYDYSMDQVFFEELELSRPDHHLGVGAGSHAQQTAVMLERIEAILEEERPEVFSCMETRTPHSPGPCCSEDEYSCGSRGGGVEKLQRSMPEEINRILADHLSMFLFCPLSRPFGTYRGKGSETEKRGGQGRG